jgi:hypothetical protein
MAVGYNPKIVTSDLICCYDAANIKSYPGSGSTWFNIVSNNHHITLAGSPTVVNGVMRFNGINQSGSTSTPNFSTGTSTVIIAARHVGTPRGYILSGFSEQWSMPSYFDGTSPFYYPGGFVYNGSANDQNWRISTGTTNVSSDSYTYYENGIERATNNAGSNGPNGFYLASRSDGANRCNCEIGIIIAYNRVLTAAEVQQNFNALRGRFGI